MRRLQIVPTWSESSEMASAFPSWPTHEVCLIIVGCPEILQNPLIRKILQNSAKNDSIHMDKLLSQTRHGVQSPEWATKWRPVRRLSGEARLGRGSARPRAWDAGQHGRSATGPESTGPVSTGPASARPESTGPEATGPGPESTGPGSTCWCRHRVSGARRPGTPASPRTPDASPNAAPYEATPTR